MPKSETTGEIAKAISLVQQGVETVPKNRTGQVGNHRYKYADLGSVWSALRPLLRDAGLAVVQLPVEPSGLSTLLLHASGEWIEERMPLAVESGATAQAQGSAITYARRYALCAALGIVADDDDDGSAATAHRGAGAARTTPARVSSPDSSKAPASPPPSPAHSFQEVIKAFQSAQLASEIFSLQDEYTEAMRGFSAEQQKKVKEARDERLEEIANRDVPPEEDDDALPF